MNEYTYSSSHSTIFPFLTFLLKRGQLSKESAHLEQYLSWKDIALEEQILLRAYPFKKLCPPEKQTEFMLFTFVNRWKTQRLNSKAI